MAPSSYKATDKAPFHPAFGVTSIKNHVALVLELETVQYDLWAELFLNTARAFEVHHHLIDPSKDDPPCPDVDQNLWNRLDAIVKQWLYATISNDLFQTVVESRSTAKKT
ncbi:uncharacterized protein LOC141649107 [Silene latifolia]|uniref:uncharacterized protein LOC141649107 n=1 Tax=Silene latifolia TaxID=37657 RepID=UPI003D781200